MKRAVLCITLLLGVSMGFADEAKKETLFDSLGGLDAVKAVVDDFVGRCAGDKRIGSFFSKTAQDPQRLAAFKQNLVDQICQAAGGPCEYKGASMKDAHAKMKVTNFHFDSLVEDLVATLNKFKVKDADKKALLSVLGPMRGDIVTAGRRDVASEHKKGKKK